MERILVVELGVDLEPEESPEEHAELVLRALRNARMRTRGKAGCEILTRVDFRDIRIIPAAAGEEVEYAYQLCRKKEIPGGLDEILLLHKQRFSGGEFHRMVNEMTVEEGPNSLIAVATYLIRKHGFTYPRGYTFAFVD